MRSLRSLKGWAIVHKWTSIICTAFLLIFCVTGLPLIFKDELRELLSEDPPYAELPSETPLADVDAIVMKARQLRADHVVWYVFVDDDEPQIVVGMLPSPTASPAQARRFKFDARTGVLIREIEPAATADLDFLDLMLRLHKDLFADLPGELFLAVMGGVFIASLISGIVLYGPFMAKLPFGAVRSKRSKRLQWLDLHNLLGIVTVAWALVVGATGVMNELSTPLFQIFQRTDVQAMLQPYRGREAPQERDLASVRDALAAVELRLPGKTATSAVFPNDRIGSPHHYLVWTKGSSALTARLFTPALVDARTGEVTAILAMPWYLRTLQVSRPLHFGDYGGLPLKIIWALLDIVTIVVLGSGLYLWLSRRRSPVETRLAEFENATNET